MAAKKAAKKSSSKKYLNLALQGGGAHGAYTWGVLDRLLEEEDIEIAGISGTSAGAINGALLVNGYLQGGRARAKEMLAEFWREISGYNTAFGQAAQDVMDHWAKFFTPDWSSTFGALEAMGRFFSPYDTNPLNVNPLRDALDKLLDLELMDDRGPIKLFVTATAVQTGHPRVFSCEEVTVDALVASACLPTLFQAVEIDGMSYWDGGYVGNPSIWPLIYHTDCDDVLLVEINPVFRADTPRTAGEIMDRINEISFNSSLISEMRAINFVKKLIEMGRLEDKEYKDIRMHLMGTPELLEEMKAGTKMYVDWSFFQELHDKGYAAAETWIKAHKKDIGKRASLDIEAMYLTNKYAVSRQEKKKASGR